MRPRPFVDAGLAPGTSTGGQVLDVGVRWDQRFDFLLQSAAIDESISSQISVERFFILGAVRWSPFRPLRGGWPPRLRDGLYAELGLGYSEIDVGTAATDTTLGNGLGVRASVGWLTDTATDWALGFELADHLAIYDANQEIRHALALLIMIHLKLPHGPFW